MADLAKFMETIKGATTAELHEFNRIIESKLQVSFKVGNRVSFDGGYRGIIKGKVTKVNQKTIGVLADNGMRWKVSPTLLTKL